MELGLLLVGGLLFLLAGGELLVRGAVLIARRLGVSPLMIGLTVVGCGTSMPELVTSVQAAFAGAPGIALGNIVGSNIANVLLILGIAALLSPIPVPTGTLLRDGGLMLAAALLLAGLSFGGVLGRFDGVLLVLCLGGYLILIWRQEQQAKAAGDEHAVPLPSGSFAVAREIGYVVAGLIGLIAGGRLLVFGAVDLAAILGVSDTVVGLTVVAVGTSLPELATSLVAALRRQSDIAYGNIVGSNIFNIFGIAGVTALTSPIAVPSEMLAFDLPVMIAVTLLMAIFAATGSRLTRLEGAALLTGYSAYILLVIA